MFIRFYVLIKKILLHVWMQRVFGLKIKMHYFTVVLINFFVLDDKDEAESEAVLNALENIDDDCDRFVLPLTIM